MLALLPAISSLFSNQIELAIQLLLSPLLLVTRVK